MSNHVYPNSFTTHASPLLEMSSVRKHEKI